MAKNKTENLEFSELKKDIKDNTLKNIYALYGEERYLLEYYANQIKKLLLPDGLEEFNHKLFDGKGLDLNMFSEAVDALPVFSERTVVEVHDLDFSKLGEEAKNSLLSIFLDVPEYVCILFIFDTVEFKLNARTKLDAALKKHVTAVKFESQSQNSLVKWIKQHFASRGKKIDDSTAEYLAFISGGLMNAIITEIEKCSAYSDSDTITRETIDAVVTPALDAAIYKMTDEVIRGRSDEAALILGDLLKMQEPPHKIIYSLSQKMRQLLAAKICVENGRGARDLMEVCDIKYDFQARNLVSSVQRISKAWCKNASRACAAAAYQMNSGGGDNRELLSQLLIELALGKRGE